jgi:hypothetical protein
MWVEPPDQLQPSFAHFHMRPPRPSALSTRSSIASSIASSSRTVNSALSFLGAGPLIHPNFSIILVLSTVCPRASLPCIDSLVVFNTGVHKIVFNTKGLRQFPVQSAVSSRKMSFFSLIMSPYVGLRPPDCVRLCKTARPSLSKIITSFGCFI